MAAKNFVGGRPTYKGTQLSILDVDTHAATSKATPVDADELPIVDSAASNVLKKLTWANLKATLKTYLDTLYPTGNGELWQGGGGDLNVGSATPVTVFSQSISVVAGTVIDFEAHVLILNNSGAIKTYTFFISLGGTDFGVAGNTTIAASATNRTAVYIKGSIEVRATNNVFWHIKEIGYTPAAANTDTSESAIANIRTKWNNTSANLTGTQTAAIKVGTSATGATQTVTALACAIRKK